MGYDHCRPRYLWVYFLMGYPQKEKHVRLIDWYVLILMGDGICDVINIDKPQVPLTHIH